MILRPSEKAEDFDQSTDLRGSKNEASHRRYLCVRLIWLFFTIWEQLQYTTLVPWLREHITPDCPRGCLHSDRAGLEPYLFWLSCTTSKLKMYQPCSCLGKTKWPISMKFPNSRTTVMPDHFYSQRLEVFPDQNSMDLTNYIIPKYTTIFPLMMDRRAGATAHWNACMSWWKHWNFIGCKIESFCFKKCPWSLAETMVRNLLNIK